MKEILLGKDLSKYNRYILNKILSAPGIEADINIYEMVKEAVSYKCILPSQNELVMETYYNIKEYLVNCEFVIERKEMTSYIFTGKGIELKASGTLEKYEYLEQKRNKKSFLHSLFFKRKNKTDIAPDNNVLVECYE